MRRAVLLVVTAFLVVSLVVYFFGMGGIKKTSDGGRVLVEVIVPALDENAKVGEALFNQSCASCHGKDAAGQEGAGPPLVHKIYEPNHHADGAFLLAVTRGVRAHHWPFGNMQPVEGLTDKNVAQIVAYVRALQVANDIY